MTVIVGIRCKDGVVIGTDSAMTFGPSAQQPTIEQPFHEKIAIVAGHIIVAGTGEIGLGQRFADVAEGLWREKAFQGKSAVDIGRLLAKGAVEDFSATEVRQGSYGALVAVPRNRTAELIEFPLSHFQPEIKTQANWYASMGSGQAVADPLLGFVRTTFWGNEPPSRQEGIFAATMVLKMACEMAPFGVAEPIQMALLSPQAKGPPTASKLTHEELLEHLDSVKGAINYFRRYREILRGTDGSITTPPVAPSSPAGFA